MNWKQIDEYHIKAGDYTICKCWRGETVLYRAWFKHKPINQISTTSLAEAKAWTENHERQRI